MRRWFRRRRRTKEPVYSSVLDLGASAVKALVVKSTDGRIEILGRGRGVHRGGIGPDGTLGDLAALQGACEQALVLAEDATEGTAGHKVVPDRVVVGVPAPWLFGSLGWGRVLRARLEEGVSASECNEAMAQAGRQAVRRLGRETNGGDWALLDAVGVSFSIDGHRVTDPIGFRGHSLEAMGLVTAAPKTLLDALREIADALQLEPPRIISEPVALAAAVPSDGLLVQVGAQTTGLILCRYGAPLVFSSIPWGGSSLIRAVADARQVSHSRALALLHAYAENRLDATDKGEIAPIVTDGLLAWLSLVVERLRSWQRPVREWPTEIHVCGGTGVLPDLLQAMGTVRWMEVLNFVQTPRIRAWDGSNLKQVTDHTPSKWQLDNVTTLALAAWTLHKRGPDTADGMLAMSLGMKESY